MNNSNKKKTYIAITSLVLIIVVIIGGIFLFKSKFNQKKVIVADGVIKFLEPDSLVEIEIDTNGQELPSTKKEGTIPVTIKMKVNNEVIEKPGTIKVQGTSTEIWPKKNWSIKIYNDEERTKILKLKIGDSIATDEWIAKADWIDPTMLRNNLSYTIWGDMVKSRTTEPKYEVQNAISQKEIVADKKVEAQGFPRVYTARIKINGEHYGITNLLLGHDPDNFNIDKDNPKHMYLEFDSRGGYTIVKTWEKFRANGIGEWINGYYPENKDMTKEQKESIDSLGKLINGSLENFKENFDKHLDKTNMIDTLIFIEAVGDWDGVSHDVEMVTYDLEKWYMLPWDKDTTFGMNWDESGIQKNSENTLLINYKKEDSTQKPWYKTYNAFTEEVEERYAELRNNNVLTTEHLREMIENVESKIPEQVWEEESTKWDSKGRPSIDETDSDQIESWFKAKLETLDKHFKYNK